MDKPILVKILCKIAHRMPWEEWSLTDAEFDVLDACSGEEIAAVAYHKSLPFNKLLRNADDLVENHNVALQKNLLKTLKSLKRDLFSDLPRAKREKTPPPDSNEVERRLLQEAINEVAGLESTTEQSQQETGDDEFIDVIEAAKNRGIHLPEHLGRPGAILLEQSANPSLLRENGDDSFLERMLDVRLPLVSRIKDNVDNTDDLPEPTVDEIAGMGHFEGERGRQLFDSLAARERTSNSDIRARVLQRQSEQFAKSVPQILGTSDIVSEPVSLSIVAQTSIQNVEGNITPQRIQAPKVAKTSGIQQEVAALPQFDNIADEMIPDITGGQPEALIDGQQEVAIEGPLEAAVEIQVEATVAASNVQQGQQQVLQQSAAVTQRTVEGLAQPQPADADTTGQLNAPVPMKKKRRRKPRKQRSPSPYEDEQEFPELHRVLIRHKHKPRKIRENNPPLRAFPHLVLDISAGIEDYGVDRAPYVFIDEEDMPVVQVVPGPEVLPLQESPEPPSAQIIVPHVQEIVVLEDIVLEFPQNIQDVPDSFPPPPVPEILIDEPMPPQIEEVEEAMDVEPQQPLAPNTDFPSPEATPNQVADRSKADYVAKRPRVEGVPETTILTPALPAIPGIRDIPSLLPNPKRITMDDITYSSLNEKSQRALMTEAEKTMTPTQLLLHKHQQASEEESRKKNAGSKKQDQPMLFETFHGPTEKMVRFVGARGKIEENPEYAMETIAFYLQVRMFMASKKKWRMNWNDVWQNFNLLNKEATQQMFELRLYELADKGLIVLHLDDDEDDIIDIEIKIKPKAARA